MQLRNFEVHRDCLAGCDEHDQQAEHEVSDLTAGSNGHARAGASCFSRVQSGLCVTDPPHEDTVHNIQKCECCQNPSFHCKRLSEPETPRRAE